MGLFDRFRKRIHEVADETDGEALSVEADSEQAKAYLDKKSKPPRHQRIGRTSIPRGDLFSLLTRGPMNQTTIGTHGMMMSPPYPSNCPKRSENVWSERNEIGNGKQRRR